MPYPHEHAARLTNPGKYQEWARTNDKFGDGIHAIWGITTDPRKSELQAIRFDAKKYTAAQAKKWLKDHGYKPIRFEPAVSKGALEVEKEVQFIYKDDSKHLVYGIVMVPDVEDTGNDVTSKEEVEKAAHAFMESSQVIGLDHTSKLDAVPVESYIAPVDITIGKEHVPEGSWVMVTKVLEDGVWLMVQAGEINAYSIGARAYRTPLPEV